MAMSFGQLKADGHSEGMLGHGGHHRVGGHGMHMGNHMSNPQTNNSNAGHTMANSHGGAMPMGC
jgi:hypothetical protein